MALVLAALIISPLALSDNVWKEASNLGVIFDSELSFDTQVIEVVQACCEQLRKLAEMRSFFCSADEDKVNYD